MNENVCLLAEQTVKQLNEKSMKIATAESCTGGLLAAYLTAVPGVSSVFEVGITSYSCRIKHEVLGVNAETLDEYGAISHDTAAEMAENIKRISGADIGVSVTGAAGPDGSEGHAPGLVYIAAAYGTGTHIKELNIEPLGRSYVREQAVKEVLKLVIECIEEC